MKDFDIQMAVSEIMQQQGLTRGYRVQKLKTHIDNPDPNVSLKGLDQSWKLDGAYTEKHVHAHISYDAMAHKMEELDAEIKELEKELGCEDGIIDIESTDDD